MPRRILFATLDLLRFWSLDGNLFGETGDRALVTDQAIAFDDDLEYQRVVVAIGSRGDDAQAVATGLAFHPELLAGTAPEGDEA